MRIRSAKLLNYRIHGTLEVTFDPSRTVIGGPNESGKSTLAEAIHRALFLRHSSTVDLEDIQPRHAAGTPEVILEFERHGDEYELHKKFKGAQGSMARLVNRSTGETLAGDEAEEKLRGLLAVGEVSPRQYRTQWSHLWVWQGTAAVDPTSAAVANDSAERLRDRLAAGAGTNLTESARDTATYTRIVAAHAETYGAKNVVLKQSDLARARAEVESAREAATAAAASLAALGDAAETVAREEATIRAARATRDEAATAVRDTEALLIRIENTERTLEQQRRVADAAASAFADLSAGDAQIRQVEQDAAAIAAAIAPQQTAIDEAIARERRCQADEAQTALLLTRTLEEQREAIRDRDLFMALERVEQLANRQSLIETSLRRIADHEAAVARLDEQLRSVPEVGQQQFDELVMLDRQLQVARGTLRAIATRIDVLSAGTAVTLAGEPLAAGAGSTLTEAADLVVAGGTAFRITPGGGQTLSEVRIAIADLEQQLGDALAAVGVPTADAARSAHATRANLQALRDQLTATGADLEGAEVRADLRQTLCDLKEAEAEIARLIAPGRERPADATARAAAAAAARLRHDAAEQAVRHAQDRAAAARTTVTTAAADRRAAESAVAASNEQAQRLAGNRTALLARYGDDRESRLAELAAAKLEAADAVTESARLLAGLRPEQVRADKERLDRTVAMATQQIAAAEVRQAEARGRLESGGTIDLHATKAAADARLGIADRRLAEVERRSRAIDLLRTLFENRRQAVAEQVAAPLRAKVAEYLDALYGAGTRVEVALTPKGLADLKVARAVAGGLTFAFAALSGGTREQVAAACRLAMAELLAGEGSCLPVVFDDAFTNSDPERIAAVQRVLDLGARRGLQIIVLSCTPREYGLLGAAAVDLPPPRHDASAGGTAAASTSSP